jgi:photosystem II stability/assembly factor-like uncharacterized protein
MTTDGTNLFVGTDTGVYQYSEGDGNWIVLGLVSNQIMALAVSNNTLYAGGVRAQGIFVSTDNGNNWKSINTGLTDKNVLALVVKDDNIFAGTEYGGIFLSINNGSNWVPFNNGLIYADIQVLYADNNPNNRGNLYAGIYGDGISVTSDGGDNWTYINNGLTNSDVHSIVCFYDNDVDTIILAGDSDGHIYRSKDNGISWVESDSGIQKYWNISAMVVCGKDLYTGTSKGIYRSTNNGEFWSVSRNGLGNIGADVSSMAVKGTKIFAGLYGDGVFVTSDNGNNWTEINNGLSDLLIQSIAVAGNNLYAGTRSSGAFISSDDGMNWQQVNSGITDLNIKALIAVDTIIFAGCSNSIFYSTNHGVNWISIDECSNKGIISSLAISGSNLFVGTNKGVWKRSLSEIITSIDEKLKQLPSRFSLEQNYPNPFNPSTTIKFSLPKASYVTLNIFNSLGQEVAKLVSQYISAGTYTTLWKAVGIPSGVYFYRITAGEFLETKKLLLIK